MIETTNDRWAEWVLDNPASPMAALQAVRDRLLDAANVGPATVLVDLGCGEGLIANAALERGATVTFTDVSQALLAHCERQLHESPHAHRARFVEASADDLAPLASDSVDVVTARSVLMYVHDKRRALAEAFRVLKPGGCLSAYDPISGFGREWQTGSFCGYDTRAVADLAARVLACWQASSDGAIYFDENELLRSAADSGFTRVRGTRVVELSHTSWLKGAWQDVLTIRPNPTADTLETALDRALTPGERERFEAVLRPLAEAGRASLWTAGQFLLAEKS